MFKAVLFDADRTVFNNDGIHELVTSKILAEIGMPNEMTNEVHTKWDEIYFREQARLMKEIGYCLDRENSARSLMMTLSEFGKQVTYEQADKFYNIMISEFSKLSKPYPDMLELISHLENKKVKMAIVSNGSTEAINNRLENAKIKKHFKFILAPCEEFPLTKPDEKIFNESLNKIGTKANETIFVGDNPLADIEGANNVGMYTVLIDREKYYTNLEDLQIPNLKITNFKEMFHLFD